MNCFCGQIANIKYRGQWLCDKHAAHDRAMFRAASIQDPWVTDQNIKACNARCEKDRYARLKAAGLCVTCGRLPASKSAVRCDVCQEKRRKWRTRFYGGNTQYFAYGRILTNTP